MEDSTTAVMSAAYDAAAESPVQKPQIKQVRPLFYMEQSKKDIMYSLIAVVVILLCLNYIPYEVSDDFRLFLYIATLLPSSVALGYTIAKHKEQKKMQQAQEPK